VLPARARRRRNAMAAAEPSCRSPLRPHDLSNTLPRSYRISKHHVLPCIPSNLAEHPDAAAAADPLRRLRSPLVLSPRLRPSALVGAPGPPPCHFSAEIRRDLARIPSTAPPPWLRNPIARGIFFSRVDLQSKELFISNLKLLGVSVKLAS
jgi:hypothetical protein